MPRTIRQYDLTADDLDAKHEEPDRCCERCGDAPAGPDSTLCRDCDTDEEE